MDRQVKAYKSASSVTGQKDRERVEKEHEILKRDYNQLLDAFQRSESIRQQQKDLIKTFKKDL